jgi:hypothetical protein
MSSICSVLEECGIGPVVAARLKKLGQQPQQTDVDVQYIAAKEAEVGKGRVSQRLATILGDADLEVDYVPDYVRKGIKYLVSRLGVPATRHSGDVVFNQDSLDDTDEVLRDDIGPLTLDENWNQPEDETSPYWPDDPGELFSDDDVPF